MQFTLLTIALFIANALAGPIAARPASTLDKRQGGATTWQSEQCQVRKQYWKGLGATDIDIAVTVQETGDQMSSNYPYGDNKSGDSACFGPFKNNWFMIRTACSAFNSQGYTSDDYGVGAQLNSNDRLALECWHEAQGYWSSWPGQALSVNFDGISGINAPTPYGEQYLSNVDAAASFYESGHDFDDYCQSNSMAPH